MKLRLDHQSKSASAPLGTVTVELGAGIKAWVFRLCHIGDNGLEHGQELDLDLSTLLTSIVNYFQQLFLERHFLTLLIVSSLVQSSHWHSSVTDAVS